MTKVRTSTISFNANYGNGEIEYFRQCYSLRMVWTGFIEAVFNVWYAVVRNTITDTHGGERICGLITNSIVQSAATVSVSSPAESQLR